MKESEYENDITKFQALKNDFWYKQLKATLKGLVLYNTITKLIILPNTC